MNRFAEKFVEQINSEKNTEKRMLLLTEYVNLYFDSNYDDVNRFLKKELKVYEELKDVNGEALIRFMLSYSFFERGEMQNGEREFNKVMQLYPKVQDSLVRSQILNFLAFTNSHQGNFDKAIEYSYACIAEGEKAGNEVAALWGFFSLAVFHYDLKDYINSEKFFTSALEGFKKNEYPYGLARCETGLASLYIQTEKLDEAEKLLNRALAYYKELDVSSGQSRALNDLGVIAKRKNQNEKALEYYKQALQIRKDTSHLQGVATTLNEITELLLAEKNYTDAGKYLTEAKEVCERINNRSKLYRTHLMFSQLYRNTNEPWKSLEHYELYDKLKAEVVGETANNKIKELQTKIATEKAEKEKEIERLKNVELKSAYDIIESKNKEITDSINYAKRIQYTLLAHEELLNYYLPEHFVLFKPKDIVSGDFYWATKKENLFYLAVCDSTGHGVPGAFMSLLNISFLNEAITEKNILQPNDVFNHARKRLIENLSHDGGQDGMDGVLCAFDFENNQLLAASANNPIWIIRKNELIEYIPDKMPVGKSPKETISFRLQTIPLQKEDCIYIFTDGYADQFGGMNGKKFKYKQLKELLLANNCQSMNEQKNTLNKIIEKWKGELEQVDDILIIGIKVQ